MTALIRGGEEGGNRQGSQCLWVPPGDGELLPIPGTGDIAGGQILVGGGQELFLGKGGVEEDYKNPHQGGVGATGVWVIFKSVVQGVFLFGLETWAVTPCMERSLGGVPGPGGDTDYVAATVA